MSVQLLEIGALNAVESINSAVPYYCLKFEARNPKFETNPNIKFPKFETCLENWNLGFRYCFEFRVSDFGFIFPLPYNTLPESNFCGFWRFYSDLLRFHR